MGHNGKPLGKTNIEALLADLQFSQVITYTRAAGATSFEAAKLIAVEAAEGGQSLEQVFRRIDQRLTP